MGPGGSTVRSLGRATSAALLLLGLVSLPVGAPAQGQASGPPGPTVRMTLEESLRAALGRSPEVRQSEAEIESILGKQLQASGLGYPQLSVVTGVGPSPRARGDQVSSPDDQQSPDITGAFVRGGIELIQPIFTWGLITNARLAAKHGVEAVKAGVDVQSRDVALRVKQAYWGAVTARTIRDFLLELRDQVLDAAARTERLVEGGFATEVDVYRIQAGVSELRKGFNQADRTLAIAQAALAAWSGQAAGTFVEPADAALPTAPRELQTLESFVAEALSRRPEFTQLREGIEARRHLVEVERKKRYPLFFVGLVGSLAYATNRDRLDNPYVIDPLNHVAVGPVLGFRYNLDFGIANGKIMEAEAEVHKLEAQWTYATDNIPLQVRNAYGVVVEARRNMETFDEAHQVTKKMLVAASSNADLGIGEPRDLADALAQYTKTRVEYLQALYAYVYGVEQLHHAVGLDIEEVRRLMPPQRGTTLKGRQP
jgi:outer membrane protein TolC